MIGERFGRLVVVGLVQGRTVVRCRCDCGSERTVKTSDMRKRKAPTRSCGCYARERISIANFKHGETPRAKHTTEWITWRSMRQRCLDPGHKSYKHYGGRGITVSAEWSSFERFLADMGRKPPGLQLERIDNNKGYTKDNCTWATRSDQARNRRERTRLADGTFAPGRKAA